jgi:hypothetical protein
MTVTHGKGKNDCKAIGGVTAKHTDTHSDIEERAHTRKKRGCPPR